jgi:hypothetical protein
VQSRVEAALGEFGLKPDDIRTSGFKVEAVRAGECRDDSRTTGECAITGHRAAQSLSAYMTKVELAGDATAAAARAGATGAGIVGLRLADPATARREANALAVADAKARAQRTADAAGMKLGTMLTLRESQAYERFDEEDLDSLPNELRISPGSDGTPPASIVVTGRRLVSVRPEPIVTTATVTATFSLLP